MDSHEWYLQFHVDKKIFINELRRCVNEPTNESEIDQLLIALEQLIESGKEICEEIEKAVLSMVTINNRRVEGVLKKLIIETKPLKTWIDQNDLESNSSAYFRVVRLLIEKASDNKTELELFEKLAAQIVQYVYREAAKDRPEAIACLRSMLKEQQVAEFVLSEIKQKLDRTDSVSLKNLCYFFEALYEHNCIEDESKIILKYFEKTDLSARKQGLFLIKTLIELKKLSTQDADSFKKFIVVVETLEESQHLITPALELIKQFDFSAKFQDFWFVACRLVLKHDSSQVKQWLLNFILRTKPPVLFDAKQTLEILEAFNAASLLDNHESLCGAPLTEFIAGNFKFVFQSLVDINWTSFTFYRLLGVVTNHIAGLPGTAFDEKFLESLRLQTEIIPKRIKHIVIRNGVQFRYCEMAASVVKALGLNASTLLMVIKVHSMGQQNDPLKPILENLETQNFLELFQPHTENEEFLMFALKSMTRRSSIEQIEKKCRVAVLSMCQETRLMCGADSWDSIITEKQLQEWLKEVTPRLADEFKANFTANDEETVNNNIYRLREGFVGIRFDSLDKTYLGELRTKMFGPLHAVLLKPNVTEGFPVKEPNSLWGLYQELDRLENSEGLLKDSESLHQSLISIIERRLDECCYDDLNETLKMVRFMLSKPWPEESSLADLLGKLFDAILYVDSKGNRTDLIILFIDIIFDAAVVNEKLKNLDIDMQLKESLASAYDRMSQKHKTRAVLYLIQNIIFEDLKTPTALTKYIRDLAIEQIREVKMPTMEQLSEMKVSYEIEHIGDFVQSFDCFNIEFRKRLRLCAAEFLTTCFKSSYPQIIEGLMEEFAKASYKKPRYFPNASIHRMKLHYLQAVYFARDAVTPRTIEILVWELLNINNQLNVTYMLEILLAKHHPNIVEILGDEKQICKLKAPAVKSIFAIAVMQLSEKKRAELFEEAEKYHDLIFPFTMGQNYGVRAYAQAAIAILHKKVTESDDFQETEFTRRLTKSADLIASSMKFKNAAKFYEALKRDFRYKFELSEICTAEVFYSKLPLLTGMPFDEVIAPEDEFSFQENASWGKTFEIAEFAEDSETLTLEEVLLAPETSQAASSNLQIKYKYQIPGDDLVNIYPNSFDGSGELKKRSSLIVVASLVNLPPNLGGLARTCEIFGVENFVIESLKLAENFEFKAVSKTAEKWLKISEVKPFQLFDFLIGMRRKGYKIVGAEQSENSVSLEKAVIPEKTVLLLGNEKEGIPANLLSLLDLTIEIPQAGVVRSLNVHVSGAVVVWEYFKQHGVPN